MPSQLKVAVVGGGIAGIAAAHRLSAEHAVTLFEASDALGGHAHAETITVENKHVTVDSAFLIFNTRTYPLFCSFLNEIGVSENIASAEMSSCFYSKDFSYSLGLPKSAIKVSPLQFLRPSFLSIFVDLWRFRRRAARDHKKLSSLKQQSIGAYLSRYGAPFREEFAYPLMAAIWSLPVEEVEKHPAGSILSYFANHSLLEGKSDRQWQTFMGSSKTYVDEFIKRFRGEIRLSSPVEKISRTLDQCCLKSMHEELGIFDRVVIATHADVALSLLDCPTESEKNLLGPWTYRSQKATLHQDASVLHSDSKYWASWNMQRKNKDYKISYYLNRLQKLPVETPVILSLGEQPIDRNLIFAEFNYRHPIFEKNSVSAQSFLPHLNRGITAFCGSYFGFGFHEDAFRSGVDAANSFSKSPFS